MGFPTACSLLLLLSAAALTQAKSVDKKPNFIYLLVDDLGYNDVGYHDDTIVSPTIDKLASEGMILENNYVAPVCSPSRGALLTGKLAWTIGEQNTVFMPYTPECLTAEYPLLMESLHDLGYRNYMLGKWHEGYCRQNCTPRARGFDEFHGFYNYAVSHYEHEVMGAMDWRLNEEPDNTTTGQYATTVLGNTAVNYISSHASDHADKPLFMYFSFPTVHTPLEAPTEEIEKFDDSNELRKIVKAMIKVTDDVISQVVTALKDNGMYDNSVIMFSSDNGGQNGLSLNKPLRGSKSSVWEGGVRVPGFIHSPLMTTSKGTVSKELFHQTDWYPTIMSLAGGDLHDALDGHDQTDFLFHGGESARDEVALHYDQYDGPQYGRGAVRSGKWKLIKGYPGGWNGYDSKAVGLYPTYMVDSLMELPAPRVRTSRRKRGGWGADPEVLKAYAAKVEDSVLLFDLEADPSETTNLADQHSDVVEELKALLEGYAEKAVPVSEKAYVTEYASDPHTAEYNGFWSPGWC